MVRVPQRLFRYHLIHDSCRMCRELPLLRKFSLMDSKGVFSSSPAILQRLSFYSTTPPPTSLFHLGRSLYRANLPKTASGCVSLLLAGYGSFASVAGAPSPRPVTVEGTEEGNLNSTRLNILLKKLEDLDIGGHGCTPGQYNHLICPSCGGGDLAYKSLSLHITEDGNSVSWICFRGSCRWKGHVNAIANADIIKSNKEIKGITKVKKREITEQMLALEPLCNEGHR